ncbi:cysteine--tRNA ligase [Candidatus Pacearchaeota archaeon]|nr:cysteine--tRNA ligase [Candidatus Pacearchaeota archaeon]
MNEIKLYNTLIRKKEIFKPIKKGEVGMYSCGPTVYWYQHIGNMRTMILVDLVKRVFLFNGLKVNHVMNITDVDDKTIRASKKEGISLKELTRKYEKIFLNDLQKLNILAPKIMPRATENIDGMIALIEKLLKKKIAYESSDGIYFSIEKSDDYGALAGLKKFKKTKERIKSDEYDKDKPRDFALWKFYTEEDGDVFWDASFGRGRPGWHIECSSMSMRNLGENFDVHTGGSDLTFPHHTNEIAQSEAVTGKKFVNYWIHGGLLSMKDGKMSKSLGNILTLTDLEKAYDALTYRYLCFLTHYRKPLQFSFENLDAAKNAYERMKRKVLELKKEEHKGNDFSKNYDTKFLEVVNDDLNMPRAMDVVWKMIDDFDFDPRRKLVLLEKFDRILGLGIDEMKEEKIDVPFGIQELIDKREKLRREKKFAEADIVRERLREKGYLLEDTEDGVEVRKV